MSSSSSRPALDPSSKLGRIQAQFQQKQMQEKEAKLLQMLDNQQQRVMEKAQGMVNKYSNPPTPVPPGKVRQMFEERRKGGGGSVNGERGRNGTLAGIDKSYPLEPLVTPPPKSRSANTKSLDPPRRVAPPVAPPPMKPLNLGSSNKPLRETPPPKKEPVTSNLSPYVLNGPPSNATKSRVSPVTGSRGKPSKTSQSPSPRVTPISSPSDDYPPASTTKYSDYATELEKREASLSNKLKGMDISSEEVKRNTRTPPSPVRRATPSSPVVVSKPKSKPSTPVKRAAPPPGLEECKMCGRYFAPDRIAKHESICKKVTTKKRKVFDPTKMRMQGTEAEPYIRHVSAKKAKPPAKSIASSQQSDAKKADWRRKHEEFIRTIRAAKEYQAHVARGGDPADLPPPPPSDNSDYVQCPHCNRKFSEGAAERHIPKCKNIKSNKR